MTATITKRADELRPGDVRLYQGWRVAFQYVSCAPPMAHMSPDHRLYSFAGLGREVNTAPASERISEWMPPDWPVEVETIALSPAQQHAEELVKFARDYLAIIDRGGVAMHEVGVAKLRAILNAIDPPKPPTLEDALKLLEKARGRIQEDQGLTVRDINEFLARARRNGE